MNSHMKSNKNSRLLVLAGILLAFVVIILGAYARLTDAGLGCPDWPGCYGQLFVPEDAAQIESANAAFPERPVEPEKAWNEMIHRYFAGTLGFLILVLAGHAVFKRRQHSKRLQQYSLSGPSATEPSYQKEPFKLPLLLLGLVMFQGALGMWTVTLNLLPVVVMGHLLGGFTVLSCLTLLFLRLSPNNLSLAAQSEQLQHFSKFAFIGIAIVITQIALGGWVSANYAALACTEFPICEAGWQNKLDFSGAFSVPEADNYEFGKHDYGQRMTMHIIHRLGALVTFAYIAWLSITLYRSANSSYMKNRSLLLGGVLVLQVGLGISNVIYSLPLPVAVLHNAVAACLLVLLVIISFTLYSSVKQSAASFSGVPHYG